LDFSSGVAPWNHAYRDKKVVSSVLRFRAFASLSFFTIMSLQLSCCQETEADGEKVRNFLLGIKDGFTTIWTMQDKWLTR
jgi:hypothetical protein